MAGLRDRKEERACIMERKGQPIRVALYNTTHDVWKPFLDITPEDVQGVTQTNFGGVFVFSKNVIQALQANQVDEKGRRGSSIFTGAIASVRGNIMTSAFSSGKHTLRALSQSLVKEFGKQNIHVSHAIIDGGILTNSARERHNDSEWEQNEDVRLSPDGIAESYLHLIKQPRSAWTWELDFSSLYRGDRFSSAEQHLKRKAPLGLAIATDMFSRLDIMLRDVSSSGARVRNHYLLNSDIPHEVGVAKNCKDIRCGTDILESPSRLEIALRQWRPASEDFLLPSNILKRDGYCSANSCLVSPITSAV
ncbi:uncharacterized protein ARMOST_20908 [Armillaria ostoyae]|uniref:Uncharacterized protein n=1 Tax=Armillaria ostoyae TaxID=47428 RepID=A0A284S8P9_ARMOS|nr:uncharacterized protein ARMOST_20908 [Armillaria ostoyae]